MANCVTCGDVLHPERAERYDYCTKPDCQARNAEGLEIVAVGVNKASDQYVVMNDRTKKEMEGGRYKKVPGVPVPPRSEPVRTPGEARRLDVGPSRASRRQWSDAQENLAVIYRSMGLKPDEIARKLGISEQLATRMLLDATTRGRR